MKTIRRLVVSLDGTWNNRDDSTNVLFSHALACACRAQEVHRQNEKGEQETMLVTQERYYQEGVGTGPLDRITGGGFGFGLDQHVRAAYNWLVQHFEDGDGTSEKPPDQIYIFGFSRGAYTARSLVGFISTCGLLRRGAPLTVSQLWENYCILGLAREERQGGLATELFGQVDPKFRRLSDLAVDPWLCRERPVTRAGERPEIRPGLVLSGTEELLVRWSRRVRITYLGVYDTVGAVGWDALSIPGLRSKLAVQHNMRPSTIIQKCRHALAMDEHRSSFVHTPFVAYVGTRTSAGEVERAEKSEEADTQRTPAPSADWGRVMAMWNRKIEQRWFVGAHSNIGGGYPDNRLAQRPLEWILEGARTAGGKDGGLLCEPTPALEVLTPARAKARDSFAEFAAPLWGTILRAKRHYRSICPPPERRANRDEAHKRELADIQAGFSLHSINESVDDSVLRYWEGCATAPPNLLEYAQRNLELSSLARKATVNLWPGAGLAPVLALVLWATLAAAGLVVTNGLFCFWPGQVPTWLLAVAAFAFPLVDWVEDAANLNLARHRSRSWVRAVLDSIFWTRSLGVVLFAFGLMGGGMAVATFGWQANNQAEAWQAAWVLMIRWGTISAAAAGGVLLGKAFNRSWNGLAIAAALAGAVTVLAGLGLVLATAFGFGHIVTAALGKVPPISVLQGSTESVRMAGWLLLLQLSFAYLLRAMAWVDEPLSKANLGRSTDLQVALTPSRVLACLDRWCAMLGDHDRRPSGACAMTSLVRQALWRDVVGFIPVYTVIMLLGLWFAAARLGWSDYWKPLQYLWLVVPLGTACCDYLENACHFRYLRLHEQGKTPPPGLTWFSSSMTCLKTIGFVSGMLTVVVAGLCVSADIAWNPSPYGVRGLLALLVTAATLAGLSGLIVWGLGYRVRNLLSAKSQKAACP